MVFSTGPARRFYLCLLRARATPISQIFSSPPFRDKYITPVRVVDLLLRWSSVAVSLAHMALSSGVLANLTKTPGLWEKGV